jgi:hypothetical protein
MWRTFDPAWYCYAYPMVERVLAAIPGKRAEDVYAALGPLHDHSPNPWFSETWYLARYEHARAAVAEGKFRSGFDHARQENNAEIAPHWLFDPVYYQERFQAVYRRPLALELDGEPYDHFLRIGQRDGLSGHWLFDPAVYAALAPYDVRARIVSDGAFATLMHHLYAGTAEPVVSNLFDPGWYLARYGHVVEEIAQGRWSCALQHYLQSSEAVLFDPNPRFSEPGYRTYFPDVAAAIAAGAFRSGFDHFLRHGQHEGRVYAPAAETPGSASAARVRPAAVTDAFPLRTRAFSHVTFLPVEADPGISGGWRFGVLGADGAPLTAFANDWCAMHRDGAAVRRLPGVYIYGGIVPNHFGHLLLDGLRNLWFVRENPELPVLWHSLIWHDDPDLPPEQFPDWLQQIWRILGLHRHRHLHIREPIEVERVILPAPGRPNLHSLHRRLTAAMAVHSTERPSAGNRVWLSRRGLPPGLGRIEPEAQVEALLAARGWDIVRPETVPVDEQVDLFSTAAVLAGSIGSAFHAVLLSACPTARLIPVTRPGVALEFYDAVAQARGLRQSYVIPEFKPFEFLGSDTIAELEDPLALADAVCAVAGVG